MFKTRELTPSETELKEKLEAELATAYMAKAKTELKEKLEAKLAAVYRIGEPTYEFRF